MVYVRQSFSKKEVIEYLMKELPEKSTFFIAGISEEMTMEKENILIEWL